MLKVEKNIIGNVTVWGIETPTGHRLHRIDGPAVIYENGANLWFIDHNIIAPNDYQQWLLDNGMDIKNLSSEDEQLIIMVWRDHSEL